MFNLRALFHKKCAEQEMDDELRFHLEKQTEQNMARGMSPRDARYAALRQFGNVGAVKEECRDTWGMRVIGELGQDIRYGLRQLRRNPGFTVVAILILAAGVCASVSIFAFVDAALVKPLPYRNPSRLVGVYESTSVIRNSNLSYLDYLDWKRMNKVFTSLEVWAGTGYLLKIRGSTEPASGTRVSAGFFRTLGVAPMLGRDFEPTDDAPGAPETVMLSYGAWQKWFGGKDAIVGSAITLSGRAYTIIGILPARFHFAPRGHTDFWTTLHPLDNCAKRRSCHNLYGVGRLRQGVTVQKADASMKLIAGGLAKLYPDSNRGQGAAVIALREAIVGPVRPILIALLAGAGLLFLIACVNVTSLFSVRSQSRMREVSVRRALGASPGRLVRQFAAEGLLLAALAGGLGLVGADWAMQFLVRLVPADRLAQLPFLQGLGLNFHVIAFAGLAILCAGMLLAVTPILHLSAAKLREGLAEGGRTAAGTLWRRFGSCLVVAELAIAVVLLVSAGLLGRSLYYLLRVDLGFHPDHLATFQVAAPAARYGNRDQAVQLGREIVSSLENLPGVGSAGVTDRLPLSGNGNTDWIRFVGHPYHGEHNEVNMRDVTAGYFTTLQARLLRGRFFNDSDTSSSHRVVIINEALAKKYFPGENPVGKQIGDTSLSPQSIREIVGVVENIREGQLNDSGIWPAEYLPFSQSPDTYFSVVVRTSQAAAPLLPTLDAAVHHLDPGLATMGQATMAERISDSPAAYLHSSAAWLVGGFAALALLLGVVGLYGVVSYSVSRRTREIGIRMALGARRSAVYQLVLGEAALLVVAGIVAGLLGSLAATTLMQQMLFGVHAWDLPTMLAVATLLAASALVACYIPARRAAKVDPMVALRYE